MLKPKALAIALPVLLIVAIWWTQVWTTRTEDVASAEEQHQQLGGEESRLIAKIRAAREFRDAGQTSIENLAGVKELIPNHADIGGLVSVHDALARATGVTVETFSPDAPDAATDDPSTPSGTVATGVTISVVGTPDRLANYLAGLFELHRMVIIDHFAVSPDGDGLLRMNLGTRAFHLDG